MMSIAYEADHATASAHDIVEHKLLLIDGRHVEPASGRFFKTLNPATGEVIATVAEGNEIDVDRAVAATEAAAACRVNWPIVRKGLRNAASFTWWKGILPAVRPSRAGTAVFRPFFH